MDDAICAGDMVRVGAGGRAALLLANETTLRLDQNSTLTLQAPEAGPSTLLDLVGGAINVISRTPRPFRVHTPFMNANIKGTEFLVAVQEDSARVSVFEGMVLADNERGGVDVAAGEAAVAGRGEAPRKDVLLKPADAVQWALYVPAVLPPAGGDIVTTDQAAAAQMRSGRLAEAGRELDESLRRDPNDATALSLQSVLALVRNDPDAALALAGRAAELSPRSAPAQIALSYAQQARLRIDAALASARQAAALEPGNALAWARVAELELSGGASWRATAAAARAVELDPKLSRTQSVMGFASLARVDTAAAAAAFGRAIELDSTDPLPRLGLGLARIRDGDLSGGREQIEVAASLDPDRSMVRSYLGKAYFEEKRDPLAGPQLAQAKQLDPRDPTPWLYDAIRKQAGNRPVEALQDLEQSIELNGNRAVYRSGLLLDEDLAARQASQARVYQDLGFDQLALLEASKSLAIDPGSAAAHRFLADAYSAVERGDITRVSESLQAQLRQPVSAPPVDLQLANDNLFILRDNGPFRLGANEFDQLYDGDGVRAQADLIGGSHHTLGDQVAVSGLDGRLGWSLGQLHYESHGFGFNDSAQKDIYDGYVAARLTPDATLQLDLKRTRLVVGETLDAFDASSVPNQLQDSANSARLGGSLRVTPRADLIWTAAYENRQDNLQPLPVAPLNSTQDLTRTFSGEVQALFHLEPFILTTGAGYLRYGDQTSSPLYGQTLQTDARSTNAYAYGQWRSPGRSLAVVMGLAGEVFNKDLNFVPDLGSAATGRHRISPKLGLTWLPDAATTVRLAAFSAVRRPFVGSQTIEPTQVSGFSQFFTGFDPYYGDFGGSDSERACFAVDRKLGALAFAGAEVTARRLKVPVYDGVISFSDAIWKERTGHLYAYKAYRLGPMQGAAGDWQLALTLDYTYEKIERPLEAPGVEGAVDVRTDKVPLGLRVFSGNGLSMGMVVRYVHQDGTFGNSFAGTTPNATAATLADVFADYRLPRRLGVLSIGARNALDRRLNLFEADPTFPSIPKGRLAYARVKIDL